jgi:cephalosporin-C deacetylase-like acetyl esterase
MFGLLLAADLSSTPGTGSGPEGLRVLPDTLNGFPVRDMVTRFLQKQVDAASERWEALYEMRIDPDSITCHHQRLREEFIRAVGGFPERTPLNAQTTGRIRREGYRVEKIVFESQPGHYVTGLLFLPDSARHTSPYPGILIPCGHYRASKAHDEYQSMGALCALHGMAALVYDPVGQGERLQLLTEDRRQIYWGTRSHTMADICAVLLGSSVARFEIWDGMRAIDYLMSRSEVDGSRIGCTGNSGGGTQTSYLMALDSRIKAAAPSCYIHRIGVQTLKAMGDAEQNIFGQLAFGMDHPDYVMMRAPMPVKLLAATHDFFDIQAVWETFRFAKRLYTRLGYSERVDILENDAGHNYDRTQREGAARWLSRWLLGEGISVSEPDIELLTGDETRCTPEGQTLKIEGARSIYHLFEDMENAFSRRRVRLWNTLSHESLRDSVRRIAGIRRLEQLPEPEIQWMGDIVRDDYRIRKMILKPEEGIWLPALYFIPEKKSPGPVCLYIHEEGMEAITGPGGPVEKKVLQGYSVLAADIRGIGETRQTGQTDLGRTFGYDWRDVYTAYLLGKSCMGMRAEDILNLTRFASSLSSGSHGKIDLVAVGYPGVPALHAAALEPGRFASVTTIRTLVSWSDVIARHRTYNQLVNTVHGSLRVYDLPDLAQLIGTKLVSEEPLDARGFPVRDGTEDDEVISTAPTLSGLAGIWYGSLDLKDPRDQDPLYKLDRKLDSQTVSRGREWSARWFGFLTAPVSGRITFYVDSDPGVELRIGNLSRSFGKNEGGQGCFSITLKRGVTYPFTVIYNHPGSETGHMIIEWSWAGRSRISVSREYLRHSPAQRREMREVW